MLHLNIHIYYSIYRNVEAAEASLKCDNHNTVQSCGICYSLLPMENNQYASHNNC